MVKVMAPEIGARAEVKSSKTGGRVKKDVGQLMAETRIRAELAVMHDDTTLPAELAAIYLCISSDLAPVFPDTAYTQYSADFLWSSARCFAA